MPNLDVKQDFGLVIVIFQDCDFYLNFEYFRQLRRNFIFFGE